MAQGHNGSGWLNETLSNRPFIVGMLFLSTYFVPFLVLIGVALAYIFRREPEEEWEASHFEFLIRTFWLPLLVAVTFFAGAAIFAAAATFLDLHFDSGDVLIATLFLLLLVMIPLLVFCGVRIVLSLMKSVAHKPIANPKSWLG